jgi:multidrug resistance efflux pump
MPFMNNIKVKAAFKNIKVNEENRMIDGIIAITGASAQVLDDSTLATVQAQIAEIEGFLNQAEAALDQIDIVLDKIDLVTAKMYEYLPENIQLRLDNARDSLAAAKKELKGLPANATEEQRAAAKEKLRKAKLEMRQSLSEAIKYYAEALVKFAKILWRATRELGQEAIASFSNKEVLLDLAKKTLDNSNGVQTPTSGFDVMDYEESNDKNTSLTTKSTDNSEQVANNHKENTLDYYKKGTNLYLSYTLRLLIEVYSSEISLKDFEANLKNKGLNIADFIFKQLRLEKEENIIVELVKQELLFFLIDTMVKK